LGPPRRIYRVAAPDAATCLRQGEILTDVRQVTLIPATIHDEKPKLRTTSHPHAVILTQDCDLDQDFFVRVAGKPSDKIIPSVFLCEVSTAEELFGIIRQTNKKLWDRIRINKDERYHFLQKVEPGCDRLNVGLPELAIDFKRYFTLPTDEVYHRIEIHHASRRCVLVSPYLEHLTSRFAFYLSRVALPEDHLSDPKEGN
jgi:hypothetical protein